MLSNNVEIIKEEIIIQGEYYVVIIYIWSISLSLNLLLYILSRIKKIHRVLQNLMRKLTKQSISYTEIIIFSEIAVKH